MVTGTVLERDGSTYRILTAGGEVRAVLRGKMKRDNPRVVVGDRVELDTEVETGLLAISAVADRSTLLARRVPEGRGTRPVAANVDQVLVITATRDPDPVPQLVDRLLVVAEANQIEPLVVLNKVDLDKGEALRRRFAGAGYLVIGTSVKSGEGIEELRLRLKDRESVITGPSGAGKSSLLNALEPGLLLRTGEISAKVRRGTHTTVSAVMVPLQIGGYLVDTPGFSEVGLWGLEPRELANCFPEFRAPVENCRYPDCSHIHEPGCAVLAARDAGAISADRWESYRVLLAELEGQPEEWE